MQCKLDGILNNLCMHEVFLYFLNEKAFKNNLSADLCKISPLYYSIHICAKMSKRLDIASHPENLSPVKTKFLLRYNFDKNNDSLESWNHGFSRIFLDRNELWMKI